jgi:uncharacterized protein YeeX (DUF496 family)
MMHTRNKREQKKADKRAKRRERAKNLEDYFGEQERDVLYDTSIFQRLPHDSRYVHRLRYKIVNDVTDISSLLKSIAADIKEECAKAFHRYGRYGLQIAANGDFRSPRDGNIFSFTGRLDRQIICNTEELSPKIMGNISDHFDRWADEVQQRESGVSIERYNHIDLEFIKAPSIRGRGYIETGFRTRSVLNIRNTDIYCILYCIDAALNPIDSKSHPQRPSNYDIYRYNMECLSFPLRVDDITKLEKYNNLEFVCNVFTFDNITKEISVIRMAKDFYDTIDPVSTKIIDLLLITKNEDSHYCLIRDFQGMMNHINKTKGYKYCRNCLNGFKRATTLQRHKELCLSNEATKTIMPDKNTKCTFKNADRQVKHPFVLYFDYEAFQPTIRGVAKHFASGYSLYNTFDKKWYIDSAENNLPTQDSSKELIKKFIKRLQVIVKQYADHMGTPMKQMTDEELIIHRDAATCYLCKKPFGIYTKDKMHKDYGMHKVKDHCHITGNYRGAAHSLCNLQVREPNFIPIFAHNLTGYDIHLFIKELCKVREDLFKLDRENNRVDISIIPKSAEKYSAVSVRFLADIKQYKGKNGEIKEYKQYVSLRFLDSLAFLNSSLEELVKNMDGDLPILERAFPIKEDNELLKQKGVFAYDWHDSVSKMDYAKLPNKESFYSKLRGDGITQEDYERAKRVWKHFKMKTWADYHNLYLLCDTLQLADVFESFRNVAIENYGLDPVYYYSTPNYAWDAMLRNTRCVDNKWVFNLNFEGKPLKLDLLHDPDMFILFENSVRGGISQVGQLRYAKADARHKLLYVDANNLYGYAMAKKLPISHFKWVSKDKIEKIEAGLKNGKRMNTETDVGCLLMVDLEYPKEIQKDHLDLPLAPEQLNIKGKWLSRNQRNYYGKSYINSIPKLCTTFFDKKKYVCYLENLQYYLDHGMKLKKIHKIIKFKQANWLEPYILYNTALRTKAKNEFEKNFFKLMNNAVFGKTMENVRKYKDIVICHPDNITRYSSSPLMHYYEQISPSLTIIHRYKAKVTMSKPIYVGAKILDLSKLLMYEYFYDQLKVKFETRIKIIYMDTDSFILYIETDDLTKELIEDLSWYDTSDYPPGHPMKTNHPDKSCNKKVIGKFKNEMAVDNIDATILYEMTEFVGLRSKCYSYSAVVIGDIIPKTPKGEKLKRDMEKSKCKGIVKNVAKRMLTFKKFKEVLDTGKDNEPVEQTRIVSKKHQLLTITEKKKNLSYFDDKKYCEDGINCFPLGYIQARLNRSA